MNLSKIVIGMSLLTLALFQPIQADIPIKSGDTIAFLGDSITRQGGGATGWCSLVIASLKSAGIDATPFNAGRGGNTSRDMADRFEVDVIGRKPQWMTLMCGTNDNPGHGLSLEESQKNITTIVDKTTAAGIKVLLMTRPMRGAVLTDTPYNDFIRKLAKEKGLPLADTFTAMAKAQSEYNVKNPSPPPKSPPYLTVPDGTHMNGMGNRVIAEAVLIALGFTPDQIAKAKGTWPALPPSDTTADAVKLGALPAVLL